MFNIQLKYICLYLLSTSVSIYCTFIYYGGGKIICNDDNILQFALDNTRKVEDHFILNTIV